MLQNIHSTLLGLSKIIKYYGAHTFYLPSNEKTQEGKSMIKYTEKWSASRFTLYHAYKTKQVALKWVEI
jgi:hypothetical protein